MNPTAIDCHLEMMKIEMKMNQSVLIKSIIIVILNEVPENKTVSVKREKNESINIAFPCVFVF